MVLFEIHQRFKEHFLNELRVSFKLLGITLDINLKFDKHVSNVCSNANRKLCALTRVAKFLPFKKRRILYKAFIELQFKYCTLVWMFHGRQIDDK